MGSSKAIATHEVSGFRTTAYFVRGFARQAGSSSPSSGVLMEEEQAMVRERTSVSLASVTFTAFLVLAGTAHAGGVDYSLQDLLGGQSVTIGAMTYTNFSHFSSVSYGGQRVDPSKVT